MEAQITAGAPKHTLTSTSVADALQGADGGGVVSGISAYSDLVIVGKALTVRLCGPEESDRPFNDYLDELFDGSVVVVDNRGRRGISVFGGLMAAEALRRGARGAVVNGDIRDVAEARELGFALFALGATPRSGRVNARLEATNEPVDWGGTRIEPRDTIVADEDGVVVVPARHAGDVLERAAALQAADATKLEQVASGIPLAATHADLGP